MKQNDQVNEQKQLDPEKQEHSNKLAATLKQLDHYKLIRKESNSEESIQQQDDEIEKENIRKVTIYLIMLLLSISSSKNYFISAFSRQYDPQHSFSLSKHTRLPGQHRIPGIFDGFLGIGFLEEGRGWLKL